MADFHITYYEKPTDKYCKGLNIEADSMIEALAIFNLDYNGIEPITVLNKKQFDRSLEIVLPEYKGVYEGAN